MLRPPVVEQDALTAWQTPNGEFFAVLDDGEGPKTFGPYKRFDELDAELRDYLARAIRALQIEVQQLGERSG